MGQLIDFRTAIVDEFGELDRQMQACKPMAQRHEALRKQIAAWFEDSAADQPCVVEGKVYAIQASPRAHKTHIQSISRLFKRLGKALFLEVVTVPVTAVRACLPEEEHENFLTEERTGARTIKAVALRSPAKAA